MDTYKIRYIIEKTISLSIIDEVLYVEITINILFQRLLVFFKPLIASSVVFPHTSQTFMTFKIYQIRGPKPCEFININTRATVVLISLIGVVSSSRGKFITPQQIRAIDQL